MSRPAAQLQVVGVDLAGSNASCCYQITKPAKLARGPVEGLLACLRDLLASCCYQRVGTGSAHLLLCGSGGALLRSVVQPVSRRSLALGLTARARRVATRSAGLLPWEPPRPCVRPPPRCAVAHNAETPAETAAAASAAAYIVRGPRGSFPLPASPGRRSALLAVISASAPCASPTTTCGML